VSCGNTSGRFECFSELSAPLDFRAVARAHGGLSRISRSDTRGLAYPFALTSAFCNPFYTHRLHQRAGTGNEIQQPMQVSLIHGGLNFPTSHVAGDGKPVQTEVLDGIFLQERSQEDFSRVLRLHVGDWFANKGDNINWFVPPNLVPSWLTNCWCSNSKLM
jgi:hypothetical protein